MTTRAIAPHALGLESVWQRGPDFLCLPIEPMPIRQDYAESNLLPDAVGITMLFEHAEKDGDIVPELSDIDLNRYSNVRKLRVTSIILAIAKVRSFKGSQLAAAGKKLQQVVHQWDWESIRTFGEGKGMDRFVTKSADASWENEVSILVKFVKNSLEVAIGTSVISFSEIQTVLFEVSNLLSER
ncbi:unnamed protein product [Mytilus coruscus]|uniref:Uncharacterized protein n=1 Tax=Mytilus coruscus TaxID=42192 RepID=A0A6J8BZL5_MYTCO|nr:unnamed protein product [Mytilus coruscus]